VVDPESYRVCRHIITRPESMRCMCWSLGRVMALLYELLRTPLGVFGPAHGTPMVAMDLCVAFFWTMNIPMTFLTGFYEEGLVEMRLSEIAARYAQTWLVPDMFLVGLDWFVCLVPYVAAVPSQVATVLRLIGFVRLSRTVAIYKHLNVVIAYLRLGNLQTLFRILVKLAVIVIINHWVACGWVFLGFREDGGWMQMSMLEDQSSAYIYMTSLHWSLTQFTPAATDIHAHTDVERVYSVCVILFALITFSSFVSSITTTMQALQAKKSERESQEMELRNFFVENNISAELGTQISRFLTKYHFSQKKRKHENDFKFLETLPGHLRRQLREELHVPVITWMPFMECLLSNDAVTVHAMAHTAVSQTTHHAGDTLFVPGDEASQVWFVIYGMADYVHEHDKKASKYSRATGDTQNTSSAMSTGLTVGTWAGDPALWLLWSHCGFMIAKTHLEVTVLDAHACREIFTKSTRSFAAAKTYATLLQIYMKSVSWKTDVWCHTQDIQQIAKLSMTRKLVPSTADSE